MTKPQTDSEKAAKADAAAADKAAATTAEAGNTVEATAEPIEANPSDVIAAAVQAQTDAQKEALGE